MSELNLYGKIKDGEIKLENTYALKQWAKTLEEGSDIVVKFRNQANYKTVRQLRLLYLCFRKLSAHLGYPVNDIKLMMKIKAGICWTHNIDGREITECKSISDFTKRELSEFVESIDTWASMELNFPLLSYEDKNFLKTV